MTFISGVLLLFCALNYGQIWIFLAFLFIGVISIIAAIKYTVGKTAYGYRGFGDLFVFIFFGLVGVIGSYILLTGTFHLLCILGALYTGLLSCGVLNMNNLRDYENDKSSNKNTIVVYMGTEKSKIYQYILLIIAAFSLIGIILFSGDFLLFISCFPLFFLVKHLFFVKTNNELEKFDSQLKIIALSCFFSCLILMTISIIT